MTDTASNPSVDVLPHNSNPSAHQIDQKAFIEHVDQDTSNKGLTPVTLFALMAAGLVLLELAFLGIIISTNKSALATQQSIISSKTQEIAGPLKDINTQVTQITDGIKTYNATKANQKDYTQLWDDLQRRIVANTRIKTLAIAESGVIKIEGEAKDFTDIANFIASLNKSTTIHNVKLVSSGSSDKAKEFSLTATYQPVASTTSQ